jgi:hypothetical protein
MHVSPMPIGARPTSEQGFWSLSHVAHFPAMPLQDGLINVHGHQVWFRLGVAVMVSYFFLRGSTALP